MDKKIIPIFFAIDDGYIPFFAVALESLIEHSSPENHYVIKVLYVNITDENQAKIKKYERDNLSIEFVDLNYYIDKVKDQLYTRDYYTQTTYFRLFIPELYPQYDKALYLDGDIVILSDVADLYNIDIGDNLVAATPDGAVQITDVFQEYVEKVVGLADYNNYFNAGIVVMNLDELRKFKFHEKFLYLLQTVKYTVAQDQDYLNRLCKGRAKIIPDTWDRMPLIGDTVPRENLHIVHYNLSYKPWHFDDILYEEYFWEYAKKTEFYDQILMLKEDYTDEERYRDLETGKRLIALAQKECDCVGDDRVNKKKQEETENESEKSPDRLAIIEKIKMLEKEGNFDVDAEEDPPTIPLMPEDIDYLRKGRYSKLKRNVANRMGKRFLNDLLRENKLIIKDVKGIENLKKVEAGALITCNHFNPFDCFAIERVFRLSGQSKHKRLYKVIREGNYTNFPGLYGFFFKNCDTLPLSSNKRTMIEFMKAVDTILGRGDYILMYPEQSLWWNYRKPKPLKPGAYKLAARNSCPIIPIFITMEDSEFIGDDGFPIQAYTVNIGRPIYPNDNLSEGENAKIMKDKNFEVWKKIYEDFYKVPLEYNTDEDKKDVVNK